MKKLLPFLLSLTTVLANAQYNRNHTQSPNNTLSVSRTSTLNVTGTGTASKQLPYFLRLPATTAPPSLTNLNDPMQPAPTSPLMQSPIIQQDSPWLKPWTPPSMGNGRFQSVQSFDMQKNISDSKATYQFTKRPK
jgi:hypothetical protein